MCWKAITCMCALKTTRAERMESQQTNQRRGVSTALADVKTCLLLSNTLGRQFCNYGQGHICSAASPAMGLLLQKGGLLVPSLCEPSPCLVAPDFRVSWFNPLIRWKKINYILFCSFIVSVCSPWDRMTVKTRFTERVTGAEGQGLLLSSAARC